MRTLTICGTPIAAFTIVLPTVPEPAEKTAADFLRHVIAASCGVTLPVSDNPTTHSIFTGSRNTTEGIKWDGFCMATDENHLYLHGNIPRGTLYAAYDFAETYLGYRYFADDCEVIPTEGTADVPANLHRIDNPGFSVRRTDCHQHMKSGELSAHSRLNDCVPVGEEHGGVEPANGACHTFHNLCPAELYFDEHPEYYSFVPTGDKGEGKRIPCLDGVGFGQLCLTNPDVLRIVTENVLKQLREHPDMQVVEVSQDDNNNRCQCEHCLKVDAEEGSPSGTLIRFVNAIAEEVEKEFPHVLVRTFAYTYTRKPPKLTKARHNVLIRYCTIEACFRHALNDPNCSKNGHVFREELEEWGKMSHQISIWDYITCWACYASPFPNLLSLRQNARFFADIGVIHVFEESNIGTSGGLTPEMKAYLAGKVLWNPYMSEEEYERHITEFLTAFYGKGWQEIRRVLDIELETSADHCPGGFHNEPDIGGIKYLSTPVIENGTELCDFLRENYVPKAYQPTVGGHHLFGFIDRLDEIKAGYDRAFALAETDVERHHLEISRFSVTYVDLFIKSRVKRNMTLEEQKAYEAEVAQFYLDKERLGCYYNIWTSNFQGR